MIAEKILVSTAYLPPIEFFSVISGAREVIIEREENYLKQTYRNRCYILSANGPQVLSIPVLLGSFHKTAVKNIKIDYSKRWQQVHLRAMVAAYKSSPYFEYYFDRIEQIISANHSFLLDLNLELIVLMLNILNISSEIAYSTCFDPIENEPDDFRYSLTPKKARQSECKSYIQVFPSKNGFVPHLSIADLIFNQGPDSNQYL